MPELKDELYVFDFSGAYVQSCESASAHSNTGLVRSPAGELYQINSGTGVSRLDGSQEVVIPPGKTNYQSALIYVGIQSEGPELVGRPVLDAAFDDDGYAYVVPVVVNPQDEEPYLAAAKLELLGSGDPPYQVVTLYDDALSLIDEQYANNPREIEIDKAGNVYVVNVHSGGSDILWKYSSNGAMLSNLPLYYSDSKSYVPDPIAMCISDTTATLYLAAAQNHPTNPNSTLIYGFSTENLTLTRSVVINNMQHVTSITEDPTTGILWVVGFSAEEEGPFSFTVSLDALLAKVSRGSNSAQAVYTSDLGCDDLKLPMSIVWTGPVGLGRVSINGDDEIDLGDFALLAERWGDSDCTAPDWCGGADLNPPLSGTGRVDVLDLLILTENWLKTTGP